MNQFVDLHCHTTASDGVFTPAVLVQRAFEKGIKVLAITDHDTIDGLLAAQSVADAVDITLINGIELSCVWNNITLHVLAYDFALEHPQLEALLINQKQARWLRAEQIAHRLEAKGMVNLLDTAITVQQQNNYANAPGRPHFAEAMMQLGYVRSQKEAFQKWLGSGKIGDVKQHWPELSSIVDSLKVSGAWLSLAHPCQYHMTRSKLNRLLTDFVTLGGQSIEVVNGFQPAEQVGKLANLSRDFGLLSSAGSDFHRPNTWCQLGLYRNMPEDLIPLWTKFPAAMAKLNQLNE